MRALIRKVTVYVLVAVIGYAISYGAAGQNPSSAGISQIAALISDKRNRTPEEQKLDSNLLFAMRAVNAKLAGIAQAEPVYVSNFIADNVRADNTVAVTIRANVTDGLLGTLTAVGAQDVTPFPSFDTITARLDITQLQTIAAHADVRFVRPLERGQHNRFEQGSLDRQQAAKEPYALPQVGSVTSQGVIAHGADQALSTGINGSGVMTCVLSDGINSLGARQSSGDIPTPLYVLSGQSGSGDEGTAMLEIVHDMAPGALLAFATANGGEAQMASNILNLRSVFGCNVIVDDYTYATEPAFQDGIVAQAVSSVTAAGAVYFSSAGNSGDISSGTSGTWEGDWVASGIGINDRGFLVPMQLFGSNPYNALLSSGQIQAITLQWSDPWGASGNDYDLFLLDSTGTFVLQQSTNSQTGSQDPFEGFPCSPATCPPGSLVIVAQYSALPRALRLDTHRGRLSVNTLGNAYGHNSASSAFTVAAVDVATAGGGIFTGAPTNYTESFSSDGPRKLFYYSNGTPITPGNLLFFTGGGTTLAKVDVAAADGVVTAEPLGGGLNPFYGTSAAAPHAAAIAALVKSANPSASWNQVVNAVHYSGLDIDWAGWDRDSGQGIVMAPAAVRAVLTPLSVSKAFAPSTISAGTTSTLTYTVTNPNSVALQNVAFTDTYPAQITNAAIPNPGGNGPGCGGTLSAGPNGGTFAMTSGTVPAGTTCHIFVTVTSSVPGSYNDTSGTVTTPIALNTPAGSAMLSVVGVAPAITSAASTTFAVGTPGTFTVMTSGIPTAAVAKTSGTLPTGVTFVDNGNGTATLSGTPIAVAGAYPLQFTASNGWLPNAVQSFTLDLNPGAAASIVASSGAVESTQITTAYPSALQATVLDVAGNGVPGISVAFTLPGSGASGTFPGPTTFANVITNASGMATSPVVTANATVGPFTATGVGASLTANYNLYNLPVPVADGGGRPEATGGSLHTVFLFGDGSIQAIGVNTAGQLGDGTNTSRNSPVPVGISQVIGISAGNQHTVAVKNDGTVWTWGLNDVGELGDGTQFSRNAPVQVTSLTNVAAVSAGGSHTLALKRDGTVWAWGDNTSGQAGDGATGGMRLSPVQVHDGGGFLTGVAAIAAGAMHSCALLSNGTEKCWGRGTEGQLGDGLATTSNVPVMVSSLTQVTQIAAGNQHSIALRLDGTVQAWGTNGSNELGDNTTSQRNTPVPVLSAPATPLTGIASIAAGADHNLAVAQNGSVMSWGMGTSGQLGSGSIGNRPTATAVATYTNAIGVFAGASSNASFVYHGRSPTQSYGQFQSFGASPNYQLAQTTSGNKLVPADIAPTVYSPLNTFRTCFAQCAGREDIFWRNTNGTNAVWFYNGDGAASIAAAFPPGVDPSWTAVGTGDIDGDGIADMVWFQPSSGQVAIWKMAGSGVFSAGFFPASVGAGSPWQPQAVADFDGDGIADILWRNTSTGEVLIWYMSPQFTIDQALSFGNVPLSWQIKGTGDVDGDWIKDIFWMNTDGTVAVWKMAQTGQYQPTFLGNVGAGSGWQIEKIGDLDGDGRADIFWRRSSDGVTAIWYLDGTAAPVGQFLVGVPAAVWTLQTIGQFTQSNAPGQVVWVDNSGNAMRWQMMGRTSSPVAQTIGGLGTGWKAVR